MHRLGLGCPVVPPIIEKSIDFINYCPPLAPNILGKTTPVVTCKFVRFKFCLEELTMDFSYFNRETNSMVEEFMLLANIYTAKKTLEEFPNCAVLRRHPAPPLTNYDPIIKVAKNKVHCHSRFI